MQAKIFATDNMSRSSPRLEKDEVGFTVSIGSEKTFWEKGQDGHPARVDGQESFVKEIGGKFVHERKNKL